MATAKITKQRVEALDPEGADAFIWDNTLKGFGVRIARNGDRTYMVQYRTSGGRAGVTQRLTIGKHGSPWTADTARDRAKVILGTVAVGGDPAAAEKAARRAMTVNELCDLYPKDGIARKKPSTIATDIGRIDRHIRPLLGRLKVIAVTKPIVVGFLNKVASGQTAADIRTKARGRAIVKGGKGVATRTLGLLGGIFSFAVDNGIVEANPVRGVKAFPDRKFERFLSLDEIAALGLALRELEQEQFNASAINIIRLLLLTGARRGEIDKLKWGEVDLRAARLNLSDSKTGRKSLPLNSAATTLLTHLHAAAGDSPFVFPATKGDGHFSGTPKIWREVRRRMNTPTLRIHDLRHSFASVGVTGGTPLMMVSKLLGHANQSTTQRYAHLADDPVRLATEQIGDTIATALG